MLKKSEYIWKFWEKVCSYYTHISWVLINFTVSTEFIKMSSSLEVSFFSRGAFSLNFKIHKTESGKRIQRVKVALHTAALKKAINPLE